VLRVLRAMRPAAGDLPLVARPNAGGPAEVGGRFVYPATPGYVAEHALAFVEEGAAVVGGCCGTGPEHTSAIAAALSLGPPRGRAGRGARRDSAESAEPDAPGAASTALAAALEAGRFRHRGGDGAAEGRRARPGSWRRPARCATPAPT
jgi:homocysteine S-methyltransferase